MWVCVCVSVQVADILFTEIWHEKINYVQYLHWMKRSFFLIVNFWSDVEAMQYTRNPHEWANSKSYQLTTVNYRENLSTFSMSFFVCVCFFPIFLAFRPSSILPMSKHHFHFLYNIYCDYYVRFVLAQWFNAITGILTIFFYICTSR